MTTNTPADRTIANHPNHNADDHAYLTAKGWADDEISARWDAERAAGNGPCKWGSDGAKAKLAATINAAR